MTHTMERTPEPEVMDGEAQSQAYAEADFEAVNEGFADAFRGRHPGFTAGHLLDLGCGPADIPRRLALALPDVSITAVDASAAMLDHARGALAADGLTDRVHLVEGFLPGALDPADRFDAGMSNSLLHHLGDPMVLWRQLRHHLRSSAPVYVMDLARPDSDAAARAIVDAHSEGEPEILRRDFLLSLHAAYTPDEVRKQLDDAGLHTLAVTTPSDRHLLVTGTLP